MDGIIEIWGESAIGRDRMENQDTIFFPGAGRDPLGEEEIAARGYLLAIAAGRGESGIGRPAGRAAVAALVPAYYGGRDSAADGLRRAVAEADAAVAARGDPATAGLIAAVIAGDTLHLAQAGGGRAYRLRDGVVELLTGGPSANGGPAKLPTRPDGPSPEFSLPIPLLPGDRVWLCSDGLAAALSDDDWRRLLAQGRPQRVATRPIDLARERISPGDLSLIVAEARPGGALSRAQLIVLGLLGVLAAGAVGWFLWELLRGLPAGGS